MIERTQALSAAAIALAVAAADQLTKQWIVATVPYGAERMLIPGCLTLAHRRNTGVALSLFAGGGPTGRIILVTVTLVALVVLTLLILRSDHDRTGRIALSVVAGGALGNLIDRVRLGYVVDFVDAHLGRYHWPTFNLADSAITLGVAFVLLQNLRTHRGRNERGEELPCTPT